MNTIANPYVGPQPFKENERDRFFGRRREARDLLALVLSEQLVLFYAQSGAGKSSLVNTCLIPDLKMKGFEIFTGRVAGDAPSGIQVENIYVFNLLRSLAPDKVDLDSLGKMTISEFLPTLRTDVPLMPDEEQDTKRHAMIIDQFEELFNTHDEAWEKRNSFFQQLAQAMEDDPYLWVILVMREDFIASLDPYAYLVPGRFRRRYYMQRLERNAALQAIKKPVEDIRPFAEGVAEKLVYDLCSIRLHRTDGKQDTQPGQYVEPVQLQVVCYTLWEHLTEGTQITENDFEVVGDVNQSLGRYYAERVKAVAKAKNVKERSIREWFEKKLISPGGIRNMVLQEPNRKSGGLSDDVIQALQSELVHAESRGGSVFYELTHDRLVEPILENNKKWFEENSSPLQRQAALWIGQDRNESWLFTDQALAEVEQWAADHPDELTEVEIDFLEACRKKQRDVERDRDLQRQREAREREIQEQKLVEAQQRAEEQTRSARITRFFLALTAIAFAIAVWEIVRANNSRTDADLAKNVALTAQADARDAEAVAISAQAKAQTSADFSRANELAAEALKPSVSFDQSILLSVAAYKKAPYNREAQNALSENFQRIERLKKIYADPQNLAESFEVSPNGEVVAIWGEGGITIWNAANNMEKYPVEDLSQKMYFSPDSKIFAAVGPDGILRWDTSSLTRMPGIFNGHPGKITRAALSKDEKTLFTVGEDNQVKRWDLSNLQGTPIPVKSGDINISPFGELLTVVDQDGNIELWNGVENKRIDGSILGRSILGSKTTFSPDGRLLAILNIDETVAVWNVETAELFEIKPELNGTIDSMIFSKEGAFLALSDRDSGETDLWDIKNQHSELVGGVAERFSQDERFLFINNGENLQPYCISSRQKISVPIYGTIAGFSQNEEIMVVQDSSGLFSLWIISDPCKLTEIEGAAFPAETIQVSPSDNILASLELDGTILLRDLVNGDPKGKLIIQSAETESGTDSDQTTEASTRQERKLMFRSDGSLLALLDENDLRLWDMTDETRPEIEVPEKVRSSQITDLLFAKDDLLITTHADGKIRTWNMQNNQVNEADMGTRGEITNLIFDPESEKFLSFSQNSIVLVDAKSGEQLSGPMFGGFLDINWESNLLASLQGGRITLWNIVTGSMKTTAIEATRADFTPDGKAMLVSNGTEITLYGTATLEPIGEPISEPVFLSYDLEFSPNSEIFALATPARPDNQGTAVFFYTIGAEGPERIYVARYIYGGKMVFPSDEKFYFSEGGSWLDVVDLSSRPLDPLDQEDESLGGGLIPIYLDSKSFILGNPRGGEGANATSLASVVLWDVENFELDAPPELIQITNVDLAQKLIVDPQDVRFRTISEEANRRDTRVLAVLSDGKVYVWVLNEEITDSNDKPVLSAAISPDGTHQATFTGDGIVLSTFGGANPSRPFNDHSLKFGSGYFNKAGNLFAALGEGAQTFFYDLSTSKPEQVGKTIEGEFDPAFANQEIWVTTNAYDETTTIWDSKTGQEVKVLASNESIEGYSADGRYIAIRNPEENKIILRDALNEDELETAIPGEFTAGTFSPNGELLALTNTENQTVLWNTSEAGFVELLEPVPGSFTAFSPDSRFLAITTTDDTGNYIILLDTSNGSALGEPIEGVYLNFRPQPDSVGPEQNPTLIAYSFEGHIFLWNLVTHSTFGPPLKGDSAEFSSDGRVLKATFTDPSTGVHTTTLLDTETGQQIVRPFVGSLVSYGTDELPLVYYSGDESGLVLIDDENRRINQEAIEGQFDRQLGWVSPHGRILVTLTDAEGLTTRRLWNRLTGDPIGAEVDYSGLMGFSQDEETLIFRNLDDTVTLRAASNPNASNVLIDAEQILFSAENRYAVAINPEEETLAIWDLNRRGEINVDPSKTDPSSLASVISSPADSGRDVLALLGSDGLVLIDVDTGEQIVAFQEKLGLVREMSFSPDNTYLASRGSDGIIVTTVGQIPKSKPRIRSDSEIIDMSFSNNNTITYLTEDFEIYEYDINADSGNSTRLGKPVNNPQAICGYALSDDGSQVALQIQDKILLWSKEERDSVSILTDSRINTSCNKDFSNLAFSPDGKILSIGDGDQIHVWNWNLESPYFVLNVSSTLSSVARIVFLEVEVDKKKTKIIAVQSAPSADPPQSPQISLWNLGSRVDIDEPFDGELPTGWTSNGSKLLYRDATRPVALRDLNVDEVLTRFNGMHADLCEIVAGRELSADEWAQFFPQEEQTPICSEPSPEPAVTTTPVP